jgi:hypothetical protein
MEVSDMVKPLLAHARARGKCPFGHIGARAEKAEDKSTISSPAVARLLSRVRAMTAYFIVILMGSLAIGAALIEAIAGKR